MLWFLIGASSDSVETMLSRGKLLVQKALENQRYSESCVSLAYGDMDNDMDGVAEQTNQSISSKLYLEYLMRYFMCGMPF